MEQFYIEGKIFDEKFILENPLCCGEYENCSFITCNFSNADFSKFSFTDCEFIDCNLSNVKLIQTALRSVKFKGCKLTGLHFDNCHEFLFAVSFDNCMLQLSSFYNRKLTKTNFANCILHEVDFTSADLTQAVFTHCDLSGAFFDNTILEKADLRTAYNYDINPAHNRLKKARFSTAGISGLLHQYDIEIE
jgi:uncharacterized protein YjbI with pentapeptide repeats